MKLPTIIRKLQGKGPAGPLCGTRIKEAVTTLKDTYRNGKKEQPDARNSSS